MTTEDPTDSSDDRTAPTDGDATASETRLDAADEDPPETDEPYADLGATTAAAMEIASTSMDRVHDLVPQETLADRVRGKSVHATGDPEFQYLCRFTGQTESEPVRAGAEAVLDERPIVTDVTMVESGITSRGHDCPVRSAIGAGKALAEETGMTRTAAAMLELDSEGVFDGAIVTVGNAPTAAFALADCIEDGTRPAAVVATPVGFVKAKESRRRLREAAGEYGVPAITNVGRRGGSGLAAGLTNELIHVASDARAGEVTLAADAGSDGVDSQVEADGG